MTSGRGWSKGAGSQDSWVVFLILRHLCACLSLYVGVDPSLPQGVPTCLWGGAGGLVGRCYRTSVMTSRRDPRGSWERWVLAGVSGG